MQKTLEAIILAIGNSDLQSFRNKLEELSENDLIQLLTKDGGNVIHWLAEYCIQHTTHFEKCVAIGEVVVQRVKQIPNFDLCSFMNFQDKNKNTPLHVCVRGSKANFVYFLIKHGANALFMKDLQNKNQSIFTADATATESLQKYSETHKIVNANGKSAVELAMEYIAELTEKKEDTKKTAAAAIAKASKLFFLPPPCEFVHKTRFSIRTAYTIGLVAKLAYIGQGSDDKKEEADYDNEITHAFLERWGFENSIIFQRENARAIVTELEGFVDDGALLGDVHNRKKQRVNIVSFRGTKDIKDILSDIAAIKTRASKCHGFILYLRKIRDLLLKNFKSKRNLTLPIYFTGHSLGGAVASLYLMKTKQKLGEKLINHDNFQLYSFGQPRPGSKIFENSFYSQKFANNVFLIQRHNDCVPLVPWFNLGFRHCGAVRYIDEHDQLAGDIHYKLHDVRRHFMRSIPDINSASLHKVRETWNSGLRLLISYTSVGQSNVSNRVEEGLFKQLKKPDQQVVGTVKTITHKKTHSIKTSSSNILRTFIRNNISFDKTIKFHSMDSYLKSLIKMQSRITSPLMSINESISSSAPVLNISQELWERMKLFSSQEQVGVYKDWLTHYISVRNPNAKISLGDTFRPKNSIVSDNNDDDNYDFTLNPNLEYFTREDAFDVIVQSVEKWFTKEQEILDAIEECEEKIKTYFKTNNIIFKEEYPNTLESNILLFPLSGLVCHGIQCICYLISQIDDEKNTKSEELNVNLPQKYDYDKQKLFAIIRKFYFSIPEDAPIICTQFEEKKDKDYLMENAGKNSEKKIHLRRNIIDFHNHFPNENVKKGIYSFIQYLSNHDPQMKYSAIIGSLAQYLPTLPFKNGYRPSVQREREEWNKKLEGLIAPSLADGEDEKYHPKIRLIINEKVKEGFLNPKYKASFEKKGKKNEFGRRAVYPLLGEQQGGAVCSDLDFYIKEFPELAGLERASEILAKQLVGEGMPCCTIGRIDYCIKNEKSSRIQRAKDILVSIPVLILDPVGTDSLQNQIQNAEVMDNLDTRRFSQLIVLQTLTLVEDAKADNFQISKLDNGKWLLHSIDNDHVFVPTVVKNTFQKDILNFKSILFCCDDMTKEVDADIKEQLAFLSIPNVIEKWLKELDVIYNLCVAEVGDENTDQSCLKLFTQEENKRIQNPIEKRIFSASLSPAQVHAAKSKIEKDRFAGGSVIQPLFAEGMVQDLCERIRKLQLDFKSVDSLTHESIFSSIHPTVAKMYKKAFDKYPYRIGGAYERFNEVTKGSYDKVAASPSQKALISSDGDVTGSPTLSSNGPTEITMTKKTGADVLKSAKVKASAKYSPSKQLDFIVDFMSEGDENTIWAKELLKNGETAAFKKYLEGLSTAFREKFINTHGQDVLLACKDNLVGDTICEALYEMNGFRTLNLSHIRSPLIYFILMNK